jgi:hypothetical protein
MAFALAVGDLCSPAAVASFASSSEPPVLGTVIAITPTKVVWQDGREVTYTQSTGASVDLGLSKVTIELGTEFQNAKIRPNGLIPNPNIDGRANGIVVLVVRVTNASVTDLQTAIVLFENGLYVAVPTLAIEVVPGA